MADVSGFGRGLRCRLAPAGGRPGRSGRPSSSIRAPARLGWQPWGVLCGV